MNRTDIKRHTRMKPMSDKKRAQLAAAGPAPRTTMDRSTPIARSGKIKRKPRTASEYARIYGSKARVAWVKYVLACVGCGRMPSDTQPNENHHITGEGMSRKAHHSLIVPLCAPCHHEWHDAGRQTFEARHRITAAVEADRIARLWQLECSRRSAPGRME